MSRQAPSGAPRGAHQHGASERAVDAERRVRHGVAMAPWSAGGVRVVWARGAGRQQGVPPWGCGDPDRCPPCFGEAAAMTDPSETPQGGQPEVPPQGIRMKLSIDNCCKFNGFMLLSQTRAEYLCCCTSFSRRLDRQTLSGSTGALQKAVQVKLGLKDRLHPTIC